MAARRLGLLLPTGFASDEPALIPMRTTSAIASPPNLDRRTRFCAVGPVPSLSLIPNSPHLEVADGRRRLAGRRLPSPS